MTKNVSVIKEINAEAEAKFDKKGAYQDGGTSSEEEPLPTKKVKAGKSQVNRIKSSEDKEDTKATVHRR